MKLLHGVDLHNSFDFLTVLSLIAATEFTMRNFEAKMHENALPAMVSRLSCILKRPFHCFIS